MSRSTNLKNSDVYSLLLRPGCFVGMTVPTREALLGGTASARLKTELMKRMHSTTGCGSTSGTRPANRTNVASNANLRKLQQAKAAAAVPWPTPAQFKNLVNAHVTVGNAVKKVPKVQMLANARKAANKASSANVTREIKNILNKQSMPGYMRNSGLPSVVPRPLGNGPQPTAVISRAASAVANQAAGKPAAGPRGVAAKVQAAVDEPWPDRTQFTKLIRAEASDKQLAALRSANPGQMTKGQLEMSNALAKKAALKTRKLKLLADARKAVEKMPDDKNTVPNGNKLYAYYRFKNILNQQNATAPGYIRGGLSPREYIPNANPLKRNWYSKSIKPKKVRTDPSVALAAIGTGSGNPGPLAVQLLTAMRTPWPDAAQFTELLAQKAPQSKRMLVLRLDNPKKARKANKDSLDVYLKVAVEVIKELPKYKSLIDVHHGMIKMDFATHAPDTYEKWTTKIDEQFGSKAPEHMKRALDTVSPAALNKAAGARARNQAALAEKLKNADQKNADFFVNNVLTDAELKELARLKLEAAANQGKEVLYNSNNEAKGLGIKGTVKIQARLRQTNKEKDWALQQAFKEQPKIIKTYYKTVQKGDAMMAKGVAKDDEEMIAEAEDLYGEAESILEQIIKVERAMGTKMTFANSAGLKIIKKGLNQALANMEITQEEYEEELRQTLKKASRKKNRNQ